ncbi:response regulator [candidate division KSB1 bacterium]|nr:response regulator [candidate division KSB1 bacterium]
MQIQKKILLIDDDEDFVEINRTILETRYDVSVAYSAQEGLEKAKSGMFDLIIVDLIMEERDSGFVFTYEIRNDPRLQHIPIILITSAPKLTGFTFDFQRDKDWLKVDDFIEKPVETQEFLRRIEKLLSQPPE